MQCRVPTGTDLSSIVVPIKGVPTDGDELILDSSDSYNQMYQVPELYSVATLMATRSSVPLKRVHNFETIRWDNRVSYYYNFI